MNRSESSESLLPSTSREPHRQDYQSIGGTVVNQCLYLISDIIYAKMHAIHFSFSAPINWNVQIENDGI